MPRGWKGKQQQKPHPVTKIESVEVNESLTPFITLRLGKEAFEGLLNSSTLDFLRWIARNTLLVTQAQNIRNRHPELKSGVDVTGGSSAEKVGVTDRVSSSAALTLVSTCASVQDVLDGDEVSFPFHSISSIVWYRTRALHCSRCVMDPPPPRPKLNLKLSLSNIKASNNSQPQTPQSAQRTPSLKLKFGGTPTPGAGPTKSIPPTPAQDDTPNGSSKKRKRQTPIGDPEHPGVGAQPARVLSLKLNTKQPPSTSKNSAITPGIKLKTKGKIPKRPQGVGYDSELEDREIDPVILEAFVLRMLPGEDCDYIRDAIANGTVGVSLLQKGADIRLRFLDVNGRRGILIVRGRQYAFTVVDLPTITEGMKSWDKKNFIKSVDVSQMCLVLGRCADDDEARNYPLPPDVNPKNYQYAHGLTAPMRNVRKRRFERTTRTRLDDIEAIERKVNSLLEADAKATDCNWEILDRDPRQDEDEFSEEEYDSDEDAAGEEDGYFPPQNGHTDTTQTQTLDQQYTHEDISALEAMFEDDPDDETAAPTLVAPPTSVTTTTATPADPSSSTAPTPAADADVEVDLDLPDADADADADADDEDPADADADDDEDSDHEASDEKAETLVKIKEAEEKIEQEKKKLKGTGNHILKKKIATKITALENDIRMMRRHAGIGEGGDVGGDEGSEEE